MVPIIVIQAFYRVEWSHSVPVVEEANKNDADADYHLGSNPFGPNSLDGASVGSRRSYGTTNNSHGGLHGQIEDGTMSTGGYESDNDILASRPTSSYVTKSGYHD